MQKSVWNSVTFTSADNSCHVTRIHLYRWAPQREREICVKISPESCRLPFSKTRKKKNISSLLYRVGFSCRSTLRPCDKYDNEITVRVLNIAHTGEEKKNSNFDSNPIIVILLLLFLLQKVWLHLRCTNKWLCCSSETTEKKLHSCSCSTCTVVLRICCTRRHLAGTCSSELHNSARA